MAALAAGGLKCNVEPRLRDHIWVKLIGNAAFNPVTALTGATMGQLGDQPAHRPAHSCQGSGRGMMGARVEPMPPEFVPGSSFVVLQ